MPQRLMFEYTGTVTATGQVNFDAIDLSRVEGMRCELELTGNAGADNTDKLDAYVQNRWRDGLWDDRVHFDQLDGSMLAGESRVATLLAAGTPLTTIEKEGEPTGSTGASRLAAGTTLNGPFAPRYRVRGNGPGTGTFTGWRIDFQVTSANSPSFPVTVRVYGDCPEN